jgi:hypothetical protein
MFLTDLLPFVFDSVVSHATGRSVLPIEREAVLNALVNSVGESVMRRVRASASSDIQVVEITTVDHFSDEWMSRAEIMAMIGRSSGLSLELSELALLLIEARLDLSVFDDGADIQEIGTFNLIDSSSDHELRQLTSRWINYFGDAFAHYAHDFREQALLLRVARGGFRPGRGIRPLIERGQAYSTFRRPTRYKIKLSKELAYTKQALSHSLVPLTPTSENTIKTT